MMRPGKSGNIGLRRFVERLETRRMLSLAVEVIWSQRPVFDATEFGPSEGTLGEFAAPFHDDSSAWELEEFPFGQEEDSANHGSVPWWDAEGMIDIDQGDASSSGGGRGGESLANPNGDASDRNFDSAFDRPANLLAEPGRSRQEAEVEDLLASLNYRPDRVGESRFGAQGSLAREGALLTSKTTPRHPGAGKQDWEHSLVAIASVDVEQSDRGREGFSPNVEGSEFSSSSREGELTGLAARSETATGQFQTLDLLTVEESDGSGRSDEQPSAEDHDRTRIRIEEAELKLDSTRPQRASPNPIPQRNENVSPPDATESDVESASNETTDSALSDPASAVALDRRQDLKHEDRPAWYTSAILIALAGAFHAVWLRLTRTTAEPSTAREFSTASSTSSTRTNPVVRKVVGGNSSAS